MTESLGVSGAGYVLPASIRYRKRGDCMNLDKLFKTQELLDKKIIDTKGLHDEDLLDKKILALQVELGELANEWRGFKFWSENQEPRTKEICYGCDGNGGYEGYIEAPMIERALVECDDCGGTGIYKNPLLEEYVDCLHFVLSIWNDRPLKIGGFDLLDESVSEHNIRVYKEESITKQFICINRTIVNYEDDHKHGTYEELLLQFIGLGEQLGFTWSQIEEAYYQKNEINHQRQKNGY